MIISFPILIENDGTKGRTLFVPGISANTRWLRDLYPELRQAIRKHFQDNLVNLNHSSLFPHTFSPSIHCKRFSGECQLRRRSIKVDLPVLSFIAFDRKMKLLPNLGDLLIPMSRSKSEADELQSSLTRYFRNIEKEHPSSLTSEPLILGKGAQVHYLDVDIPLESSFSGPKETKGLSSFNTSRVKDGESELSKNGKALHYSWPDGLSRVYHLESETAQLRRLLTNPSPKPVLLVGKGKIGKSSLFEETVYQIIKERPEAKRQTYKGGFWKIHTNRLMAGMSHVGDWQKRLMTIAEHAEKQSLTLFFENLAALFHLGRSADSQLCMTDILRPYLEQQRFRFVAKATEESLARLRELDRGFVDLFEIVRLREVNRSTTLKILIGATRDIENHYPVNIDASVIPLVESLQRRFNKNEALVGGIVGFLKDLAAKRTHGQKYASGKVIKARTTIDTDDVLKHFSSRSGFSLNFIDSRNRCPHKEIRQALRRQWIGQDDALDILTDTISVVRAGLQDPTKPYGCFLFLGPTGVGKTECAKGLARYLFGENDRLLRFDMNEFVSPGSAVRLCGSADAPEGILTSAVRQQPFSVILFDEIEKAHPDVYDLLLQVMGEGRLSDALGRDVDFTNTFVLMTSNLGVREAAQSSGFGGDNPADEAFLDAARRFFRPEFFNRLDAVIPFKRLDRDDIGHIGQQLLKAFLERPGFQQRYASLRLTPEAESWLIDKGYDPVFGARALKRVVEDTLANPVAAALAKQPPGTPVAIIVEKVDSGLVCKAKPIPNATAGKAWRPDIQDGNRLAYLKVASAHVAELISRIYSEDSEPFQYGSSHLSPFDYDVDEISLSYRLRDLSEDISTFKEQFEDELMQSRINGLRSAKSRPFSKDLNDHDVNSGHWQSIFAADDINLFFDEILSNQSKLRPIDQVRRVDIDTDRWMYNVPEPTLNSLCEELIIMDNITDPNAPEKYWMLLYDKNLEGFFERNFLGRWDFQEPDYDGHGFDIKLKDEARRNALGFESTDLIADEYDQYLVDREINLTKLRFSSKELSTAHSLSWSWFRGKNLDRLLLPFVGTYLGVCRESGANELNQCALFPIEDETDPYAVLKSRLGEQHPMGPYGELIYILRGYDVLDMRSGQTHRAHGANRFFQRVHLECPPNLKERWQDAGL